MIHNNIICYDFETGSKNPSRTQPLQLAAVVIDTKRLKICDGGVFQSYIKPVSLDKSECDELGIDNIEEEALAVNGIKLEDLEKAPLLENVWKDFVDFNHRFNPSKKAWSGLIRCGYNIVNFDNVIVNRLCKQYGPFDEKWHTQNLFHPTHNYDIMHDIAKWTESLKINSNNSISLDSVREWMGIDKCGAHNALNDVLVCAFIQIKLLKLYRHFTQKVNFENSFKEENKSIAELMEKHCG